MTKRPAVFINWEIDMLDFVLRKGMLVQAEPIFSKCPCCGDTLRRWRLFLDTSRPEFANVCELQVPDQAVTVIG